MRLKEKSWIWNLTWPFAHNNYTAIAGCLFYPKGDKPSDKIVAHEQIHAAQQARVGLAKYAFLYLFCLPLFRNRWRWEWEAEAFRGAYSYTDEEIAEELGSWRYGWLTNRKKERK